MTLLKILNRRLTGPSHEGISNLAKYALGIAVVDVYIGLSEIA